jgi:pimeloyl-ACP methyl ester carboxylesterase
VAPELPSEDLYAGLEEYADTIERALEGADDVVLVPHSLGGLVGSMAAAWSTTWAARTGATRRRRRASCTATWAPEDARWAAERLRPQAQKSQTEPSLTPPPGLRVESIIGASDRVVSPAWSRRVARERLGVEPIELPSGHFPMITHPEPLADALAQLDAE